MADIVIVVAKSECTHMRSLVDPFEQVANRSVSEANPTERSRYLNCDR